MRLRGKVAVMTGGKRLGVHIAKALAKKGVNLVLTYLHSKKNAEKTAEECRNFGVQAYAAKIDVSRGKEVKKMFRFTVQKFGRVDFLITMASTFDKTPFEKLNEKIWDDAIGNTLTSTFLCAKDAATIMLKQKSGGKIIFFGDDKVEKPYAGRLPYLTAKAGVHMMTKILAKELPLKILVNTVTPGYIHLSQKPVPARIKKLYAKILDPKIVTKKVIWLLEKNTKISGRIFKFG